MDIFSKYKFGAWGIAILVILNIALMSVLWYDHFKKPLPPQPPNRDNAFGDNFLIRELNLTEEQSRLFQEMRWQHTRQNDAIRTEINKLTRLIISELFNPESDTARVRLLSEDIGRKQAEFERNVFRHFSELKALCHPEQQVKLQALLFEILDNNKRQNPPPPPYQQPFQNQPPPPDQQPPQNQPPLSLPGEGR